MFCFNEVYAIKLIENIIPRLQMHDEDETASISTNLTDETSHQEHKSASQTKVGVNNFIVVLLCLWFLFFVLFSHIITEMFSNQNHKLKKKCWNKSKKCKSLQKKFCCFSLILTNLFFSSWWHLLNVTWKKSVFLAFGLWWLISELLF